MTMRTDRLANAIVAVGGPEGRCSQCGTNADALARLVLEVIDQLGGDGLTTMPDDNVRSLVPPSVLDEARALVDGSRQDDYGDPVECMEKWAQCLVILFGWDADAHKASLAMTVLKIVRETNRPKRDNRVDGIGYLDIADRSAERMPS